MPTRFEEAVADREYWIKIIEDLNATAAQRTRMDHHLPARIFRRGENPVAGASGVSVSNTTSPVQKEKFGINIHGLYLNASPKGVSVVDEFIKNLSGSPYYDVEVVNRTPPTGLQLDLRLRTEPLPQEPDQTEMNWISENKFLAGFIGFLVVGVGALGFLLFMAMGDYGDTVHEEYVAKVQKLNGLQTLVPLSQPWRI